MATYQEDNRISPNGGNNNISFANGYPPERNRLSPTTTPPNMPPVTGGQPVGYPPENNQLGPTTTPPNMPPIGSEGYPPGTMGPDGTLINNPNSPWTNIQDPADPNINGNARQASAGAADYAGVQDFADAAYDNSRRYLDPQQAQDERRYEQQLINKGIDPFSEQGRMQLEMMMRGHGDQDQGAAFGAMQFGQGIQEQMFRQSATNAGMANDMTNANRNRDLTRYGMDQNYGLGMGNLELNRQGQDFNEYMGYENIDYRNNMFNENNQRWDDSLAMQFAGFQPPYSGGMEGEVGNSYSPWDEWMNNINTGRN